MIVAGIAALGLVALLGRWKRDGPARCPPGLVASGPRCCGAGQEYDGAVCRGAATQCAKTQLLTNGECRADTGRVKITGASLHLAVDDWDLEGRAIELGEVELATFWIDRTEVTLEEWRRCVDEGQCAAPESGANIDATLPVRSITAAEGAAYCAWAGGRLPESREWLLAAAGSSGRRYPWGPFGLVCRRAVYGLETGPCAELPEPAAGQNPAAGPEVPGARPDGATPEGLLDIAGNVAEWTIEGTNENGHLTYGARGGSYRSTLASQLKVLGVRHPSANEPDVGVRCAYDGPG